MQVEEKTKIKGIIRQFRLRVDEKRKDFVVGKLREYIKTKDVSILETLMSMGFLIAHTEQENLITTVGREVMARLLSGETTYSGEINYGALGSSTTTPANSDTTLGTETVRFLASSQAYDENIAYIDFFIEAGTATGTHEEFGNFIDGTATVDTGQMWSHILTGGWVKGASDSLFISCQYTFS